MTLYLKQFLRCTGVLSLFVLVTACSATKNTEPVDYSETMIDSGQAGVTRCGEQISWDHVATLDVGNQQAPLEAAENQFPNAEFVTDQFMLVPVRISVAKTKSALRRNFARQGCNVLVFGEVITYRTKSGPGTYVGSGLKGFTRKMLGILWGSDNGEVFIPATALSMR